VTPPAESYKIRGWFIKSETRQNGDGVTPLVIVSLPHGLPMDAYQVVYPGGAYEMTFARNMRGLASDLVAAGYHVLFYNYEAHNYSQGWNRYHDFTPPGDHEIRNIVTLEPTGLVVTDSVETGNAVNIFHMIDQLTDGCLTYNPHKGDSMPVQRPLIPAGTPVILYGMSHGSMLSMKAMQLRFDSPQGLTNDYSGYNLRGVIQSDGVSCIKYDDFYEYAIDVYGFPFCPAQYMFQQGQGRVVFYNEYIPDGSMLASVPKFPAWMGVKAVHDDLLPDGEVETFNRARGIKEVVTVMGNHGYTMMGPNLPYVTGKILKFCQKATASAPQMNNHATTTLEKEVLKAPYVNLQTWYPGGDYQAGGMLKNGANQSLENILKQAYGYYQSQQ
jgi:hypothetical protein